MSPSPDKRFLGKVLLAAGVSMFLVVLIFRKEIAPHQKVTYTDCECEDCLCTDKASLMVIINEKYAPDDRLIVRNVNDDILYVQKKQL
jgi:hypothetical protein